MVNVEFNVLTRKVKEKRIWINLVPYFIFVVVFIALISINYQTSFLTLFNSVIKNAAPSAIVAVGAIFIYAMGSFDISLGISTAISAAVGTTVYNSTHNVFLLFLVCVLVGFGLGLINSCLAGIFRLPIFVTTIALTTVLTLGLALVTSTIIGNGFKLDYLGYEFEQWWSLLIVLAFFILIWFIFNFTKLGRQAKMISSNENTAKLSGINKTFVTVMAFAISGIGVGLAAFVTLNNDPLVTTTTASSIGLDVMVAIVFGGMPLSGGARSKVSAALIGALVVGMIKFLFNGELSNYISIIEGVLFLVLVGITSIGYRNRYLVK